jgi:hypothetical protein
VRKSAAGQPPAEFDYDDYNFSVTLFSSQRAEQGGIRNEGLSEGINEGINEGLKKLFKTITFSSCGLKSAVFPHPILERPTGVGGKNNLKEFDSRSLA